MITIKIETDDSSIFVMKHSDIDTYKTIVKNIKRKKNLEFNNTFILFKHITKAWYEEEE